MRFLNLSVERFGVLNNAQLNDLSSGLTVVYGPNGSGKSTLVTFTEGLLYGFDAEHEGFQPGEQQFGGAAELDCNGRSLRMTRERSRGRSSDLSTIDLATGVSVSAATAQPPAWVNETVFKEIFSVGHHEASRFDLLSRLCLDDTGQAASPEEIRRTEEAIQQAISEREGNGVNSGLRGEMSELRRRREQLVAQLEELRRVDHRIPARIAEVEAELRRLQDSLAGIEARVREIEMRIRQLEEKLEELRRRNTLELDRRQIEGELQALQDRQRQWDSIRKDINRQLGDVPLTEHSLRNRDSLTSVRALVSRLEQRMESLQSSTSLNAAGTSQDVFVEHLRSEVYSLCDYVAQHEAAVGTHEAALESLFGQRTLQDAENVNTVLQGQIDACREELNRCEDILHIKAVHRRECTQPGHVEFQRTHTYRVVDGTIEEIESEIARLRRELDVVRGEHGQVTARIHSLQSELVQLQGQLRSAPSLEDIDRVKADIAGIDAQLQLCQDRWNVLEETERRLREVLARLLEYRAPRVLELASTYINRLTDGDCYELLADDRNLGIVAKTRRNDYPSALQHLSHGTRDQVALALRLALVQCRADDHGRCPLLLDDVFISADDERSRAVVDLLLEVAREGQQIIFLTCQKDVRDLFVQKGATLRTLGEQAPVALPAPVSQPAPVPQPAPQFVAPPPPPAPVPAPVVWTTPEPEPAPEPQPAVETNTNWLFYLEVDNSIEDLSGLTVAEVEALRASELDTIDALMTISVDDLEQRFRDRGYSISRERIRAWRGQAELSMLVPMLRRSDAELLYAAGVESTVELSRMRPEIVFERVTAFQDSQAGGRFRRSGRSIDRQQAINWSRWSQHSRTLSDARRSRSRFFVERDSERNSPHSSSRSRSGGSTGSSSSSRSTRSSRSGRSERRSRMSRRSSSSTRRQRVPRLSSVDREERERRQHRRRERVARHSSSYRTRSESSERATKESERELKFYLNRSDDVEAAPSIGPKTAQRLATVGIYTVDDLLKADGVSVAARLDNRRISADTIVQWQAQARLVCTVPELRGHDSQILVACGVTEAEQLSAKRPVDLFAVVGPFADTSEGERIVRGGKKPDLEEVTDWIRFAQQARTLRAAA